MLPKELIASVKSRAGLLSRRYYFLEKEDLMQDGFIFLMEIEKKRLTRKQKHKAINNMFSNIERHAQYQQRIERNSSSYESEVEYSGEEDITKDIERADITKNLVNRLTNQELLLIEWLSNGWSLDKIANKLGITRHRVREIARRIIDIRRKVEECQ